MTVVPIRPGVALPPPRGEVDEDVIKVLTDLLEAAHAGEVVGVAYAAQHPQKTTSWHRAGYGTRALLGAVTLLQADICRTELESD
jgi:hypothetical protein